MKGAIAPCLVVFCVEPTLFLFLFLHSSPLFNYYYTYARDMYRRSSGRERRFGGNA